MLKKEKLNITFLTATRAEFGLLRNLISRCYDENLFNVKLIVSGTHLSEKHGFTIKEIKKSGFKIDKEIDIKISSDNPFDIANSSAIGLKGFIKAFDELSSDLIVVLGDRYEILSAVIAACFARIPIAHIHGGELTEGLIDDSIRHAITKFSHLHFVANKEYRRRVIQLGEDPKFVFNVGGMGIDSLSNIKKLDLASVENLIKLKLNKKSFLITYHPLTLNDELSKKEFDQLLNALENLKDTSLIFTMPNADPGNNYIYERIKEFTKKNNSSRYFKSLGQQIYFSLLNYVDGVIGNSSSGLLEMPYFKKATINIGDRQKGRLSASSVINCRGDKNEISRAISKVYSTKFMEKLKDINCPYGAPGASKRIIDQLKRVDYSNLLQKKFFDLAIK